MSETRLMKFTFPDGEEQEHAVPFPLLSIVKLVQRRDIDLIAVERLALWIAFERMR